MLCPNCGKELNKDKLYCEYCGEEIHIVPEFEPDIDSEISETMSNLVETVEPESALHKEIHQNISGNSKIMDYFIKRKNLIIFSSIMLSFFVIFIFFFLGMNQHQDSKLAEAMLLYENQEYEEAIQIYEKILKKDKNTAASINYAECLYAIGNYDKAINYLYAILEENPENEIAIAVIISMLDGQRDYEEINLLLQNCNNESIKEKYKNYMAESPEFSISSGSYDKVIPLVLSTSSNCKIFYSLDGTNPEKSGEEYTAPIYLTAGNYTVKAITMNDFGILSEIREEKYVINCKVPREPQVTPDSGIYNSPMMITVLSDPNTTIYYTTDNSIPTDQSLLYGEAIPMKEGTSNFHFIAIDENGQSSEVTSRTYQLQIDTSLAAEDSITRLKHRLIQKEMILDIEGHIPDRKGNYIYVYDSLRMVQNKSMHTIAEYYTEDGRHRNKTGRIYAIDVSNGYVYMIKELENGEIELDPI